MENKNKHIRVGFSTILWAVIGVLLCAATNALGGYVSESGPIYDPPADGWLWVTGAGTVVDLYAFGTYDVYIDPGATVNFRSGAKALSVTAYGGSHLDLFGGSITNVISAFAGAYVTVHGAYVSHTDDSLDPAAHYDATVKTLVIDDTTNGWTDTLSCRYEGATDDSMIPFSTFANIQFTVVVDTTPPVITCPGDIVIEAQSPEGVPVDDDCIQTFLAGASATDDCDPSPEIVNDAPTEFFPPGDTVVTFTATDASGNSSDCFSTVTVVEAGDSITVNIEKAKVCWHHSDIHVEGKLYLPQGVWKNDLKLVGRAVVTLAEVKVADQNVEFDIKGKKDDKWKYKDKENLNGPIKEFKIDWKGSKFDYKEGVAKFKLVSAFDSWLFPWDSAPSPKKLEIEISLGEDLNTISGSDLIGVEKIWTKKDDKHWDYK